MCKTLLNAACKIKVSGPGTSKNGLLGSFLPWVDPGGVRPRVRPQGGWTQGAPTGGERGSRKERDEANKGWLKTGRKRRGDHSNR